MKISNKKKVKIIVFILGIISIMTISYTLAFLTDQEVKTNEFTIGNVDIELTEPNYSTIDSDGDGIYDVSQSLVPGTKINKDPTITNVGNNDAYVYARVIVPVTNDINNVTQTQQDVVVNAYAIQAQNLGDSINVTNTEWIDTFSKETGKHNSLEGKIKLFKYTVDDTVWTLVDSLTLIDDTMVTYTYYLNNILKAGESVTLFSSVEFDDTVIISQSSTNKTIGIDMYGNRVNMDYWTDNLQGSSTLVGSSYVYSPGYIGPIVDGTIVGEIPMYVKTESDSDFKPITSLWFTFATLNLTHLPNLPASIISLNSAFRYSASTNLDLSNWDTSNVTDMGFAFFSCTSLTNLNISTWNTDNVNTMTEMFMLSESLKEIDVSSFNTSNVTDMWAMFDGCKNLTRLDLSSFNINEVTKMNYMFANCSKLTNIYVGSNWVINSSCTTDGMFTACGTSEVTHI